MTCIVLPAAQKSSKAEWTSGCLKGWARQGSLLSLTTKRWSLKPELPLAFDHVLFAHAVAQMLGRAWRGFADVRLRRVFQVSFNASVVVTEAQFRDASLLFGIHG